MNPFKPELLAPAGNLEKLQIAYKFGADACYIGGYVFGLRKYAENFSLDQMKTAVDFANDHGKKVYLVLNGFAHNADLEALKPHLDAVQKIAPHGLIISDLGVWQLAGEHTDISRHVSTQASVTNWHTVKFWKDHGATRVILAREVSISECEEILKKCPIELEVFVHGAMCASYSGKCVISNYTAGRDSNRGGCIQTCRHTFDLADANGNTEQANIMNARDLMGIRQLPDIINAGLHSVKIEGRMKSNLYVANTIAAYRDAIDYFSTTPTPDEAQIQAFEDRLSQVSNRTFTSGGLNSRPGGNSIHYTFNGYSKGVHFIGTVCQTTPNETVYIQVKSPFKVGDTIEIYHQNHSTTPLSVSDIRTLDNQPISQARPNMMIKLPWINGINAHDIIRKPI